MPKKNLLRALSVVISFFLLANFASPVIAQLAEAVERVILPIPDHLKLKTDPDHLIGTKEYPNGDVSYAYRKYEITDEPSPETLQKAAQHGLRITQEILTKRTKHARVFATDKANTYVAEIISGAPQYYRDGNGTWWQSEYGTTTKAMFDEQTRPNIISRLFLPQALAATTTDFYPSTTVDGQLNREEASPTGWTTIHDATSAPANDTQSVITLELRTETTNNTWKQLIRGIVTFDTSLIGDTDNIDSATLSLYGSVDQGNSFSVSHNIIEATPDSSIALASTDYDNFATTTIFSTAKTQASLSESSYNDYSLNSNGLLNINKSGVSKFGILIEADRQNIPPTWVSNGDSNYSYYSSEAGGTANDPKLTVVYSAGTPPPTIATEIRKSVDQSLSSETNISANPDSHLVLTLDGNKTYMIDGMIFASSTSAGPDIKIGFRYPVDAIGRFGFMAASDSFRHAEFIQNRETPSGRIPITANTPIVIHIAGTLKMSGSGTTTLLWAQATSNSTPITVIEGSYLRADPIE